MISLAWFFAAVLTASSISFFVGVYMTGIKCADAQRLTYELAQAVRRVVGAGHRLDAAHRSAGAILFARREFLDSSRACDVLLREVFQVTDAE